jgi:serpin B
MKPALCILFAAGILPALLLTACAPTGKLAVSGLKRVTDPAVGSGSLEQLTTGNLAFAFDLYQALGGGQDNMVFSPYSISLAFAMVQGGARGQTAAQLMDVLHFTLPPEQFHPAFNALDLDLARRPQQAAGVDEKDRFQLNIANALWGQQDWPFLPAFLDLLAANYGAGMHLVDFQSDPESARRQINDWVSDQTHNRIRDILAPGTIDSSTRLALANAIYLKATWEQEFDPNETSERPFTLLDGNEVNVPTMGMTSGRDYSYATGQDWQAIALPYRGSLTEMLVILPQAGMFERFASSLTPEGYAGILGALQPQQVQLSIPKFTFESLYGLSDTLKQMGVVDAFDPSLADFSGMDGGRTLFITDAVHKAFIAVDEKGTEAAAATVVLMGLTSMRPEGIVLTIDRPFLYFIRDVPTGAILFMGQVVDPR